MYEGLLQFLFIMNQGSPMYKGRLGGVSTSTHSSRVVASRSSTPSNFLRNKFNQIPFELVVNVQTDLMVDILYALHL